VTNVSLTAAISFRTSWRLQGRSATNWKRNGDLANWEGSWSATACDFQNLDFAKTQVGCLS